MHFPLPGIALLCVCVAPTAFALAVSAEPWLSLFLRDAATCGGDASLTQCGATFPSSFCCPTGSQCMSLNTTTSTAIICCPPDNDCATINTVTCDASQQNATLHPANELHADPTVPLPICGNACCPLGYACQNGVCYAQLALASSTPSATSSSGAPSSSATTTTTTASSSTTVIAPLGGVATAGTSSVAASATEADQSVAGSSPGFNGSSFAAGFVPGLFLGILAAILVFWVLLRRERDHRPSEKDHMRQQQNTSSAGAMFPWNRQPHHRTISGPRPSSDPNGCERVIVQRSTPPRWERPDDVEAGFTPDNRYNVHVEGPATPSSAPRTPGRTPRMMSLWPHSLRIGLTPSPDTPKPTHSPLPEHLRRGTINGMPIGLPGKKISPLRALKKQKSFQSLRRQVTDASMRTNGSRRFRPDVSRGGSTESIVVLMPSNEPYTPEHRPHKAPEQPQTLPSSTYAQRTAQQAQQHGTQENERQTSRSWETQSSSDLSPIEDAMQETSSSRYPSQIPPSPAGPRYKLSKPPQIPPLHNGGKLDSPYTPSRYYGPGNGKVTGVVVGDQVGLQVERAGDKDRPVTTFSNLMEKAGLRKEDLVMGTDARGAQR